MAIVLIGILILGGFKLKAILTEHFLKAQAVEIQEEEVTQDRGNLPQAITDGYQELQLDDPVSEIVRCDLILAGSMVYPVGPNTDQGDSE